MKPRAKNRRPSTRTSDAKPNEKRPPLSHSSSSTQSINKNRKRQAAEPSVPGSTKIMRKAGFSGKLHRGHVIDAKTDLATSCAIKDQCGACIYVNTNYGESLRKKFDAGVAILKSAGVLESTQILDPLPSPTPLGYRSNFKLAVRPYSQPTKAATTGSPAPRRFSIGLFEPGTHRVTVDLTNCPVHTKPLSDLLKDLQCEIELCPIEPFNETTGLGDLRYIAARSSHLTGEIMLTFVVNQPQKYELIKLVNRLRRLGHKINSAHMNINSSKGNAIFGQEVILLAGNPALRERICDLDIEIGPLSFFQVNPWQASNLYRRVETHAGRGQAGDAAWDLYTGTGQIALLLARSGYRALGVEEIVSATSDAAINAQRNKLQANATFLAAKVEDFESLVPQWATQPKVIVVNPSRRGLHEGARSHLAHLLRTHQQAKFIYVSCEVETLARDLKALTLSGHKVRQVEAFDMFAQTDKLEWLAVLTR